MSRTRSATISIGLVAALGCAHPAGPPPAPHPAASEAAARNDGTPVVRRRDIAKLAMGDAVIAVFARNDGRVEVAADAAGGSLVLDLAPADVDQWAKITTQILKSRARARRGHSHVDRSTLAEPGVVAGALTFSREAKGRSVVYDLFFADRHFGGFPVRITRHDASVLVGTMRRAAAAALAMQRTPSDSAITAPDTTRGP